MLYFARRPRYRQTRNSSFRWNHFFTYERAFRWAAADFSQRCDWCVSLKCKTHFSTPHIITYRATRVSDRTKLRFTMKDVVYRERRTSFLSFLNVSSRNAVRKILRRKCLRPTEKIESPSVLRENKQQRWTRTFYYTIRFNSFNNYGTKENMIESSINSSSIV